MGADIHIIVEQRIKSQRGRDRWIGIFSSDKTKYNPDLLGVYRNYTFFSNLAGVRGFGPKPKGFPKDASDLAKLVSAQWDSDGHSHSYVSAKKFCELYRDSYHEDMELKYVEERKKKCTYEILGLDDDRIPLEDYRVLFFFDC